MKRLTKLEAVAAIVSLALILLLGLARHLALRAGVRQDIADLAMGVSLLLLFCVFAFSCIGLMLHAFVALQVRIGNSAMPLIGFLIRHEHGTTFALWSFLGLGTLIAVPFALEGLGVQMPLAGSQGVLVAGIGMTLDEVKARSTLRLKEPRQMGDGSRMGVEQAVFEFRIGNSGVRFPQSRYYWLETGKAGDPHVTVLNIAITPRKMPKPDLDAFQRRLQGQLFADGWTPGHYLAESEETVRMWSGRRTAGDGRYWAKGNTLLIFERSRMDEEKRGEAPGSGEYILYIQLRAKGGDPKLIFESSAWSDHP